MFRSKQNITLQQPRRFNFIEGNNANIAGNPQFQFARKHSLCHYPSGAIYSFIPKNACTTMRASLAVANGFLGEGDLDKQINWIHNNTYTFSATQQELVKSPYTFTILRDPFERLFSMFWDKFVDKTPVAWNFYRMNNNEIELDDLTFEQFICTLKDKPHILRGDIHWRPQSDFLVYEEYDDYFSFSDLERVFSVIEKKTGIRPIDTRSITNHGKKVESKIISLGNYFDKPISRLKNIKSQKITPDISVIFNDNLRKITETLYIKDFYINNRRE